MNEWDVSKVTDLSSLFFGQWGFNEDISGWDVSKVTDLTKMFYQCQAFNKDISGWDVSRVTKMEQTFAMWFGSQFTGTGLHNLTNWDVSRVTNMRQIFWTNNQFNGDLSRWDVTKVKDFYNGLSGNGFNADISGWSMSSVTNMDSMFAGGESACSGIINLRIPSFGERSDWPELESEKLILMNRLFYRTKQFNADISQWDTSLVGGMRLMFGDATAFNIDISGWDVSRVTTMEEMFYNTEGFGADLSNWDVSSAYGANMFKLAGGKTSGWVYVNPHADNISPSQSKALLCGEHWAKIDGYSFAVDVGTSNIHINPYGDALCSCTSGHYFNDSSCHLCPIGFYQSATVVRKLTGDCLSCPAGQIHEQGPGSKSVADCSGSCPAGYFSDETGLNSVTQCKICPTGRYSAEVGATDVANCTSCPRGAVLLEFDNGVISGVARQNCKRRSVCVCFVLPIFLVATLRHINTHMMPTPNSTHIRHRLPRWQIQPRSPAQRDKYLIHLQGLRDWILHFRRRQPILSPRGVHRLRKGHVCKSRGCGSYSLQSLPCWAVQSSVNTDRVPQMRCRETSH
jgi:surface protein